MATTFHRSARGRFEMRGSFPALQRTPLRFLAVALLALTASTTVHADNTLAIGSGAAAPGSTIELPVTATIDVEIQGFSTVIGFDPEFVTPGAPEFAGTITEAALGGSPEYVGQQNQNSVYTVGVILDLDPTNLVSIPASPTIPTELMRIPFALDPGLIPAGQSTPIELLSSGGTPTVSTIFSSFGLSVTPSLTSGAITIDNSFRLFIPDTDVAAGAPTELVVHAEHVLDLAGFQISCVFDNSAFEVTLPLSNEGWTSGLDTGSFEIDFLNSEFSAALPFPQNDLGGFTVAALFDGAPPFDEILFASPDSTLVRIPIEVNAALGECPFFAFQNQIPTIELDNLLVSDVGDGLFPILDSPTICVVPPADFRRGDANAQDGTVNIADAIFLLEFLFAGGLIPPCFPAADTNDDEALNIADAVSILGYLFSGDPPPVAPGPLDCGADPTPGPSCATYGAGC